jgi:nifR3 family TIM-barrel protein
MAGITDHAFRSFMRRMGAGVLVTELISATGIEYANQKTLDLMGFDEAQRPVGIQLFGEDPDTMANAAKVAEAKGCDFVDINFGCPVPKVVKKGAGSAMMKDLPNMQAMFRAMRAAVQLPITIKIRTGWDANQRNALDVCNLAADEGITWVAIHGRTRAQGYSGLADWDFIANIKAKTKIPILGNGDILTPEMANARLRETGCDGVLIGRGALKDPLIFHNSMRLFHRDNPQHAHPNVNENFAHIFEDLYETLGKHCEPHLVGIQLRKFAAWYSSGYPGAAHFRKTLFQSKDTLESYRLAVEFFTNIHVSQKEDTQSEGFLMGGHG